MPTCTDAAESGNLQLLIELHESGAEWDTMTTAYAAKNGHLECLQYLYNNGCPWDQLTCSNAAFNGHLECLQFAHENGCPWTHWTTANAADNSNYDCLVYCLENGCTFDLNLCWNAARNKDLRSLRLADSYGCPMDNMTCVYAADYGSLECLRYLHEEKGFPISYLECNVAVKSGHLDCLAYLVENECEFYIRTVWQAMNLFKFDCFTYLYSRLSPKQIADFWKLPPDTNGNMIVTGRNITPVSVFLQKSYDAIDLEEHLWRSTLFDTDLTQHPILQQKVYNKKQEIKNIRMACTEALNKVIVDQVITFCIHHYI